ADIAECSDTFAVYAASSALRTIFQQKQSAPSRNFADRLNIGGSAAHVHNYQAGSARGNFGFRICRIHRECVINVSEHGDRAEIYYRRNHGDPQIGRDDDLLTRTNSECGERYVKRTRSAGQSQAMRGALKCCKLRLEG